MTERENRIAEMEKDYEAILGRSFKVAMGRYPGSYGHFFAEEFVDLGYHKLGENDVVIHLNELPCMTCPIPKTVRDTVDCSTVCGAVRGGIDWKNQCRALVKERDTRTHDLALEIYQDYIRYLLTEEEQREYAHRYGLKESDL